MPDTIPDLASWGIDLSRYTVFVPPDPFEDHVGPFYFDLQGDARQAGTVHCVLPTLARHGNYMGGVHGGGILTFADYALCLVAGRAADGGTNSSFAMTVSIAVEFLNGARIGPPLEARGEPLQVTGRLAFARGSITQEGRTIALWSGVCRHVARAKAMARKDEQAPSRIALPPQVVPEGFEPFKASAYSTHIGPAFVRKEADGASLVQPTLARMCNSGGALHGGYMMSFADTAITRAAAMTSDLAPTTVSFAAEFLAAGDISAPLFTRVEVPKQGRSIAFLRGLLEQNGKALLSYSATVMLRPRA
ncbi:PaaI family thioesterase [Reyranella sp.]|uniref:PaaI family thioesterase n=1 Tax=Reyranella sp. TaxID=1929291 RepID=UPI003D0FF3D7